MPRLKAIDVGVINIKIHPHTAERYVDLIQEVFKIGDKVPIRGSDWGMPNRISHAKSIAELSGTFYKFLQINKNDPWLDTRERKPIKTEDGKPIPQVDDYKKPNVKEIEFVFFPEHHFLFYNIKSLSPNSAKKLLEGLFQHHNIIQKYGKVDVEVVSSTEVIEKILKIPFLTKLEIMVTRPNGDDISDQEKKILKRMEKQGVRTLKEITTSEKNEGIKPDDDTKALMKVALSDGSVNAIGYEGAIRVTESTDPHPLTERIRYNPDKQTVFQAIMAASSQMLEKIKRR